MSHEPGRRPPTKPSNSILRFLIPTFIGGIALVAIIAAIWMVNYNVQKIREESLKKVRDSLSESDAYREAVARARASRMVIAELGEPIKDDADGAKGLLKTMGISGEAHLMIPLSGSKSSGTLYADGRKENGAWRFYTLAVRANGKQINLQT